MGITKPIRGRRVDIAVNRYKTCRNALFDETWGEYKCKELKKRIQSCYNLCVGCKFYAKGEPGTAAVKKEESDD